MILGAALAGGKQSFDVGPVSLIDINPAHEVMDSGRDRDAF